MTIRLPLDSLPASAAARHAALREYFCDKDATATLSGGEWELVLAWPGDPDRHVDPRLDEGLAWWGEGVERSTMALARRRAGSALRALYDTWTLHSWSRLLASWGRPPEHLVVLHVDDHFDLASPRLIVESDGWRDAITGAKVDLSAPDSVRDAILSGAIGMGSFLTPLLHFVPTAEVRHLRQPPKTTATCNHRFVPGTEPDALLHPGAPRPSIELVEHQGPIGPGCYRVTADVGDWLEGVGDGPVGPVLLHLDLDYFNNRYDGDSDWQERANLLDPPLTTVRQRIDEIAAELHRRGLTARLEDVVIAFSPGFFPAEHWGAVDAGLRSALDV